MKKNIPIYDLASISDTRSKDIIISRFAPFYESHKSLENPHGHNFYHVLFFNSGKGHHSIDFQKFKVGPDRIYFMAPGQVHSWEFTEPGDGYIINFSEAFFSEFLNTNLPDNFSFFRGRAAESVFKVPAALSVRLRGIFESILDEQLQPRNMSKHMIILQLMEIFILVSRLKHAEKGQEVNGSQPVFNEVLLHNFQKLIESNFRSIKLPKEYAELLYVTPNHLNALCSDVLGKTAGELIRERIFLEARRLLVNPGLSISFISDNLNFYDNSYFTKAFRKEVGLTPEEFRRQNLSSSKREASEKENNYTIKNSTNEYISK